MRLRSAIVAGLIIAGATIGNSRAETNPPYEIVRSLQALHDQMVLGSRAAQTAMPGLLRKLGDRLVAADPSVWRDPRNVRAIVVYILSGGEIRVARKVLESGKCNAAEKRLIEGALAYLEGFEATAKSLLENVDPRSLEPAVGSHIALAQAALIAQDNPGKAMSLLDIARILAPGTLVEDAALRREVFLAEEAADFDKFAAMSDQYLRRFRRSVYADSFHRNLSIAIIRLSQSGDAQQLALLSSLLKELSSHEQLRLYLRIAQSSVISGKVSAARWAAEEAAQLAPKNGLEAHRATLYDGAASVLTTDYDHGLTELDGLDAAHLPHDDALLKEAALGLAAQIRQWPSTQEQADQRTIAPAAAPPRPQDNSSTVLPGALAATVSSSDAMIAQAQKMLADSDALLEGEAP
ncbi:MAG: chemotaxis protein MotC [Methylovirgula sp.]